MNLDHTDRINSVLSPMPFYNIYRHLGRLRWPVYNLLYTDNLLIRCQSSLPSCYPPDTDPHNNKYTYMPIGSSIHNAQYIHDFENYY